MKTIKLTNPEPERIDKILAEQLKVSRSRIQKLIKASKILMGGGPVVVKQLVSEGDEVEVDMDSLIIKKGDHEPPKLEIIFEDDDVLVINKQAPLLVHETESSDEPTVVDGLLALHPETKGVGDAEDRPGIVHRLDKPASGVMITAKTQKAFDFLKKQFKDRLVKKKYTVLVHGTMGESYGTIDMPISRAKKTGRMAAKPESQGGRNAITHFEVIKQYPHHALLDVEIETGRTHQIRAHFFAKGHSVVGDTLYTQKAFKVRLIGRLFLHASELTITLPSGEKKTFTAPLPKELETVLEEIPKL